MPGGDKEAISGSTTRLAYNMIYRDNERMSI